MSAALPYLVSELFSRFFPPMNVYLFVCEQRKRTRSTLMITALHHLSSSNNNIIIIIARTDDYQFVKAAAAYLAYKHFIKKFA